MGHGLYTFGYWILPRVLFCLELISVNREEDKKTGLTTSLPRSFVPVDGIEEIINVQT